MIRDEYLTGALGAESSFTSSTFAYQRRRASLSPCRVDFRGKCEDILAVLEADFSERPTDIVEPFKSIIRCEASSVIFLHHVLKRLTDRVEKGEIPRILRVSPCVNLSSTDFACHFYGGDFYVSHTSISFGGCAEATRFSAVQGSSATVVAVAIFSQLIM